MGNPYSNVHFPDQKEKNELLALEKSCRVPSSQGRKPLARSDDVREAVLAAAFRTAVAHTTRFGRTSDNHRLLVFTLVSCLD
jgi:hypothetical protein